MQHWLLWMAAGILSLIGGIFAFANPFAATLTAELLAGYTFLLIGILTILSAFQDQGWGARIWAVFLGVVITLLGIHLVANPLEGMVTLTAAVAILMLVMGIFRIVIAFTPVAAGIRIYLLIAGAISLALAFMIISNFPWSSAVVLGVFLAVELVSNGISLIFLALDRRKANAAA